MATTPKLTQAELDKGEKNAKNIKIAAANAKLKKDQKTAKELQAKIDGIRGDTVDYSKTYSRYRSNAATAAASGGFYIDTDIPWIGPGSTAQWLSEAAKVQVSIDAANKRGLDATRDLVVKEQKLLNTVRNDRNALVLLKTGKSPLPTSGGSHPADDSSNKTLTTSVPKSAKYAYNVPMTKGNYFKGIQSEMTDGSGAGPGGSSKDAEEFWTKDKAGHVIVGRGTIQADRTTASDPKVLANLLPKYKNIGGTTPNMWGFKFLYNPEVIEMSWGSINKTDPVYEASNQDVTAPGTQNLVSSQITFNLVLNRIQDFYYLDSNGLIAGMNNPYPTTVTPPAEELKLIYEKGTMYDVEYLFKALFSIGTYSLFNSFLMKTHTSDPGWLPMWPVELHLGNQLRYRVRISNMSVHHSMFNDRMIPTLSTVSLTCARYYDSSYLPK